MTQTDLSSFRVGIIGGSYGGLCAALAMRCIGADAQIYERSSVTSRVGGGIVVQPDFAEYLDRYDYARPDSVGVPTIERRYLDEHGDVARSSPDATFYTGWDTLLGALEAAFGERHITRGVSFQDLHPVERGVAVSLSEGEPREFDLVIGADGIGSSVRRAVAPGTDTRYAGYVGYRGLIPEQMLKANLRAFYQDAFTLRAYRGGHLLAYFIPGANGSTEPGQRRLNWVWYLREPLRYRPHAHRSLRGEASVFTFTRFDVERGHSRVDPESEA